MAVLDMNQNRRLGLTDSDLAFKARKAFQEAARCLEDLRTAGLDVEIQGNFDWWPGRAPGDQYEAPRLRITRNY